MPFTFGKLIDVVNFCIDEVDTDYPDLGPSLRRLVKIAEYMAAMLPNVSVQDALGILKKLDCIIVS